MFTHSINTNLKQCNILLLSTFTDHHPIQKAGNKIFHFLCDAFEREVLFKQEINGFTVYNSNDNLRLIDNSILKLEFNNDSDLSISKIVNKLPILLNQSNLTIQYIFLAINTDLYHACSVSNSLFNPNIDRHVRLCAAALKKFSVNNQAIPVFAIMTSLSDKPIDEELRRAITKELEGGGISSHLILSFNDGNMDYDKEEVRRIFGKHILLNNGIRIKPE